MIDKKYIVVTDLGKPDEQSFNNENEVFNYIDIVKDLMLKEDYPYCEIKIYLNDEDVTDNIFKQYELITVFNSLMRDFIKKNNLMHADLKRLCLNFLNIKEEVLTTILLT